MKEQKEQTKTKEGKVLCPTNCYATGALGLNLLATFTSFGGPLIYLVGWGANEEYSTGDSVSTELLTVPILKSATDLSECKQVLANCSCRKIIKRLHNFLCRERGGLNPIAYFSNVLYNVYSNSEQVINNS